ncbi:MAG: hypothetical protein H7249_18475 [Chitinophagaceae bacterium]|nr:hypothetical protein [Oligoflexus sp.]
MRSIKLTTCVPLALAYLALTQGLHARERPLMVYGWPIAETDPDKILLNQDAIMGTYVCPSLTRLNLGAGKSELVLLQKLMQSDKQWTFELKPGLKWWDGKALETRDLNEYLDRELPNLVKKIGSEQWALPGHHIETNSKGAIIVWDKPPVFGPYIFNRLPFYRRGAQGLDCVGSLHPQKSDEGLSLTGTMGGKERGLVLNKPTPNTAITPKDAYVSFRFGEEMHPPTWERQIEEELSCSNSIDVPVMTMIAWNPDGHYTKDEQFRKAMTYIMPRGALLRAGAGSLGDLISAPILRLHPGYKKSLLVMPYDLKKADAILNQLGLMRSEKDGYRRTAQGQFVEITISADKSHDSSLLRKVLDDSFRALGMKLSLLSNDAKADGVLAGIQGSWPENDLSSILHSKRSGSFWPWSYNYPEIDEAMGRYNMSLTQEKPNFGLLEAIHELVYKREPFSVLVQHKSCMQYGKGMTPPKVISVRNPDWVRAVFER